MKIAWSIVVSLVLFSSLGAQTIAYTFAAPMAAHHEAEISVTATKLTAGAVYFRMSRSSPGRYAKHEFGKNIYNVKAFDGQGKPLPVQKTDADIYKITGHTGTLKVTYTLYANYADGTYASIDRNGYHLNMPATFMWVKGLEKAPVSLMFTLPDATWKIATQLPPANSANTFTAPDLQYFMDSPTKAGKLLFTEWIETNTDNKQFTFRIAFDGETTPALLEAFTKKVERVVKEAKKVFGEFPAYDYGTYTFLASINPFVKGDGMEHRNSTMITIPQKFDGTDDLLGVFSHEFFHCWNVERIRPADIEPFDFEKSNMSDGLWVAEGFTQYYGDLILMRAGFTNYSNFLRAMGRLVNTKMNTAGAQNYTPIENSQRAVFVDAGVSIDKTNYQNMYSSYYTYGGAIALALDLDLRNNFKDISLDNFMQELWKRFGKTGNPYKVSDLSDALSAITNKTYATTFFANYVYGHLPFNYGPPLLRAGVLLQPADSLSPWIGINSFEQGNSSLKLAANTIVNTSLYNTGADIGDVLIAIDGKQLKTRSELNSVLQAHKPGETLPFSYEHQSKTIDTTITLMSNPMMELKELKNEKTEQQKDFSNRWLGTKN